MSWSVGGGRLGRLGAGRNRAKRREVGLERVLLLKGDRKDECVKETGSGSCLDKSRNVQFPKGGSNSPWRGMRCRVQGVAMHKQGNLREREGKGGPLFSDAGGRFFY